MIRRISLVMACIGLSVAAVTFVAGTASAQTDDPPLEEPSIEDFTDAEGNVDLDGYIAVLNAFLEAGGELALTGSDQGELVAWGAGAVLVGGTMVLWVRDRRRRSASAA